MATVFKRPGSSFWQINYVDHAGERQVLSSRTRDKSAAKLIAKKLEVDAALKRAGVIDPRLDKLAKQAADPISLHLDSFGTFQLRRASASHVETTRRMIEWICDSNEWELLNEIDADGVSECMAELLNAGRSTRTVESYIQAIRSFIRWAIKNEKLAFDPIATVEKPRIERTFQRRFLSHDEFHWLASVTQQDGESFGMPGPERVMLYTLAIQTGLRSGELRKLTRSSLKLTKPPAYVLARASTTKNKKMARQYIHPELADELRKHVARKSPGARLFSMPADYDVVEMFRQDVASARAAWLASVLDPQERIESEASDFLKAESAEGDVLDFHALRHTCASWLIEAGADAKQIQTVMRHSTITLTMNTYGHLFPGSEADAVAKTRSAFQRPRKWKTGQ